MEQIRDWTLVVAVIVAFGTLANLYLSTKHNVLKDAVLDVKDTLREELSGLRNDNEKLERSVKDQLAIFDARLDAMLGLCDNRMAPVREGLSIDKNEIIKIKKDLELCMQFFYDSKAIWESKADILRDIKDLKHRIALVEVEDEV